MGGCSLSGAKLGKEFRDISSQGDTEIEGDYEVM